MKNKQTSAESGLLNNVAFRRVADASVSANFTPPTLARKRNSGLPDAALCIGCSVCHCSPRFTTFSHRSCRIRDRRRTNWTTIARERTALGDSASKIRLWWRRFMETARQPMTTGSIRAADELMLWPAGVSTTPTTIYKTGRHYMCQTHRDVCRLRRVSLTPSDVRLTLTSIRAPGDLSVCPAVHDFSSVNSKSIGRKETRSRVLLAAASGHDVSRYRSMTESIDRFTTLRQNDMFYHWLKRFIDHTCLSHWQISICFSNISCPYAFSPTTVMFLLSVATHSPCIPNTLLRIERNLTDTRVKS